MLRQRSRHLAQTPGLVDPVDNRAHPDMDAPTFIQSATSLRLTLLAATAGPNFPTGQPAPFFNQLPRPNGPK